MPHIVFNQNKIVDYNSELLNFLVILIIILIIILVSITTIKNVETSSERVLRLQKRKFEYHIKKLNKERTVKLADENKKRSLDESLSIGIESPLPKRLKIDDINKSNENSQNKSNRKIYYQKKIANESPELKLIRLNTQKLSTRKSRLVINKKVNQLLEIENFNKQIYDLIDKICEICLRKFYIEGVKYYTICDKTNINLNRAGFNFVANSKILCCHSCHSSLTRNKIPAISHINK